MPTTIKFDLRHFTSRLSAPNTKNEQLYHQEILMALKRTKINFFLFLNFSFFLFFGNRVFVPYTCTPASPRPPLNNFSQPAPAPAAAGWLVVAIRDVHSTLPHRHTRNKIALKSPQPPRAGVTGCWQYTTSATTESPPRGLKRKHPATTKTTTAATSQPPRNPQPHQHNQTTARPPCNEKRRKQYNYIIL